MSTITPLPTPPSRDDPTNFSARADDFLGALPTFATETNTVAAEVVTNKNTAVTAAGTATTQANTATTQAGIATTQANTATTQAGIATTKASEALSSANAAAASYDAFDDRYLGAKASNPTLDNDGNALLTGALYWNTTVPEMRTYTGSVWVTSSIVGGTVTTLTITGNTTLGDADTDTITQAASYVTGTQLKSAKTATNTLNLAAYDVDGAAYTNLVTLTASNTPTLALTSTGVGTINNMSIGATTRAAGNFTTLDANGNVTLGNAAADTVTVNGTTNFVAAPVLPTGAIPQAALAANVAGTGPAFSAYLSATQTVTANVLTKIVFDAENFDTNNAHLNGTFNPQVAGYYQINARATSLVTTTNTMSLIYLYKNGNQYARGNYSATAMRCLVINELVYFNGTTDYLEVYGQSTNTVIIGDASGIATAFSASLVRAA